MKKLFLIAMILICSISCNVGFDNDTEIVKEPNIEKYVDIEIVGMRKSITIIGSMKSTGFPILVRVKIIGQKLDFFVTLKIPSNMQQELEKKETMLVILYPSGYIEFYLHNYNAYPFKFLIRPDHRLIKFIREELKWKKLTV